jgi:hypothetical protein
MYQATSRKHHLGKYRLHDIKPCDIAPLIFKASKRKKWCAMQAMINDAWIGNNTLDEDFTMDQPSAT